MLKEWKQLWKIELFYVSAFSEVKQHSALIQELTCQAYKAETILLQNSSILGRWNWKIVQNCFDEVQAVTFIADAWMVVKYDDLCICLGMVMTANFVMNIDRNRNVPLFPDNMVKPFYASGLAIAIAVADD